MPYDLVNELQAEIAQGHVLVVVGAGVSIGAAQGNPLASWQGLLEDGVDRCVAVRGLDAKWADRVRAEIRSGDMDDLLSAAEKISSKLGFPTGGEYRNWLRDTVGTLEAQNRSALEPLRDLNLPLAATNYDGLLEEVTGFPPVTWRDGDKAIRVIRRQEDGILHLHGYWDEPESVILGIRSYEHILRDGHAQAVLRALQTLKTFLFVGCGEGLADPNFGALLRWAREVFKDGGVRHYRLCKEDELDKLRALHKDDHIFPLSYGPDHADLGPFLRKLGSFSPGGGEKKKEVGPSPTSVVPVPRLPSRPRCFGREDEVRDLVETLLQASPPPTPILGGPGVGKTTISLEALHDPRVGARFGARRFFVRCDSARSREDLVGTIVRTIGLKPGPDVEASLFEELARDPAVLVLDNAETPWEAGKTAVSEFLSDLGSIADLALVASVRGHERPWGPNWREAIQVGPLQPNAARKAFLDKSGRNFESDPDLDGLLEEVDRLAIAVVLLGYHAQALESLAELRQQWRDQKTALLQRDGGQGRQENVEVSIELSISGPRMIPEARQLLSVLAHLPDGVAVDDLEALLPGQGGAAASVLRKVGLAFNQGPRVRVLAPVREYVRSQHPPQDEDLYRAIEHYLELAREGDRVGTEGGAEVVAKLVQDLGNFESMITKGLEKADPEPAIWAAVGLGEFVYFSGWGSPAPVERALDKARESGRERLNAACVRRLGDIALSRSDLDAARAYYEEALSLFCGVDDVLGEANCIWSLGDIALHRSDYDDARAHYEEALPLFRRVSDLLGEANCIRRFGDIALYRSDNVEARARYEEALPIYRRLGSVRGEANCIQGLGDVAFYRSDNDEARARYMEALPIYQRVGDVLGEANCVQGLGNIALDRSDHDEARARYEEALPIYRRLSYVLGEAYFIERLGDIALARSDHDEACSRYEEALQIYRRLSYVLGEAYCIERLGDIALDRFDLDEARARFEDALPFYRRISDVRGEANCIHGLGDIALEHSDRDGARARYEEALPLHRRAGDVLGEANCHLHLGEIALHNADHQNSALVRCEQALSLYRSIGSVHGEAACIEHLGDIAFRRSDHEEARARYEMALPLYRRVGSVLGEADCIKKLGDIALERPAPEIAGARFAEALGLYQKIPKPYSIGQTHVRLARLAPEGSAERRSHLRAARQVWESVKRPDLVKELREEFGDIPGTGP